MRNLLLPVLVCVCLASGQVDSKPSSRQDDKAGHSPASNVAPDAVVVTVKGLCSQPPEAGKPCETVVTRAQFEKLVDAIQPTMDQQSRRHLGGAYPQFLIMAKEAQQRGVEKTERFQERMNFARLQILSQELTRQIQEEAAQVPDQEIADYYQKNSREYETADLERIIIPLRDEKGKLSADAMKEEAEKLRARAAAGEDFATLQKAAYGAAGVSGDTAPNPSMHGMRRRSLPLTQASAFELKAGEVSGVITDNTGHYVYKMDSKGMVPLSDARKEIWNVLRQQRARKMIESIQQPFSTDVNTAYFGTDKGED